MRPKPSINTVHQRKGCHTHTHTHTHKFGLLRASCFEGQLAEFIHGATLRTSHPGFQAIQHVIHLALEDVELISIARTEAHPDRGHFCTSGAKQAAGLAPAATKYPTHARTQPRPPMSHLRSKSTQPMQVPKTIHIPLRKNKSFSQRPPTPLISAKDC